MFSDSAIYRSDPLYERLQTFELDKPKVILPFSARLARDNMWTADHAERVCAEYRRFLFLACTAGHVVTPSADVDEAWHLHMIYTESYWIDLCRDVLGRPLHHTPTEGGDAELALYRDRYTETLVSYRRTFGHEPPPDIWPDVDTRFRHAGSRRTIDGERYWLVPKPRHGTRRLFMAFAGLALCAAGYFDVGAAMGWDFQPRSSLRVLASCFGPVFPLTTSISLLLRSAWMGAGAVVVDVVDAVARWYPLTSSLP